MLSIISILFMVGIIMLLLSFILQIRPNKVHWYAGILLILILFLGACQSADELPSKSTATTDATTLSQETSLLPVSPISPVSPVSTPQPTVTEVAFSEIELSGCLLFVSNRSGDFEIYKWQQNSDKLQQLTHNSGLNIDPDWSSDGSKIVFASNYKPGAGFQIYVMNADGTGQQRVGPSQPGDNSNPDWLPDNRQIVFQSKRDINGIPTDDNFDLYLMDVNGSNIHRLTVSSADDTEPNWSPDGSQIAFLSERSGQDEVYMLEPDSADIRQLTELNVLKSGLKWSNDGQFLIFEGDGNLYTVNVKTKQIEKLPIFKDASKITPEWGQENTQIIFSSNHGQNWNLYLFDQSDPQALKIAQITNHSQLNRDPNWFPCTP